MKSEEYEESLKRGKHSSGWGGGVTKTHGKLQYHSNIAVCVTKNFLILI